MINEISLFVIITIFTNHAFADCPGLVIANATLTVPNTGSPCASNTTGTVCRVRCASNFQIQGNSPVTCQSNGTWTPSTYCAPTCSLCTNAGTDSCLLQGRNLTCLCADCYSGTFCEVRHYILPPTSASLSLSPATPSFSKAVTLTPTLTFPSTCKSPNSFSKSYVWSYSTTASNSTTFQFHGEKAYTIPARSLVIGYPYTFNVSVYTSYRTDLYIANLSTTVMVLHSPLLAQIQGGNREVSQMNNLYLDGSSSSDPDSSTTSLMYEWTCQYLNGSQCLDLQAIQPLPAFDQQVLIVPNRSLGLTLHIFTLTVSDPASSRTASTTVNITLVNYFVPSLSISLLSPSIPTINPQDTLKLYGVVNNDNKSFFFSYAWQETNYDLPLNNKTYVTTNGLSLVILPGYLEMGKTYLFQLTARVWNQNSMTSVSAFVSITVRYPPIVGNCSVSPQSGYTLIDTFTLSCDNWSSTDPNHPTLLYSFAYKFNANDNNVTILTDLHASPSSSVYLPQGNLTLVANVYTEDGALTTATFGPVEVKALNGSSACLIENYTNTILLQAQELGDDDQVIQLVDLMLQLMLNDSFITSNLNLNISCSTEGLNVSVNAFRTQLWFQFLSILNTTTSRGEVSSTVATQLAQVLVVLTEALFDTSVIGVNNTKEQTDALNLVINMLRVILTGVSEHNALSQSVVLVLSTLLETAPCSYLQDVIDLMNLLASNAVSGTVPDEEFVAFVAPRVNSTGVRLSVGSDATNITLNGLQFSLTSEMLAMNGTGPLNSAFVDVTITRYDNAVRRCRTSPDGQKPSGDIISIDLSYNVSNLTKPFTFYLPLDQGVDLSSHGDCDTPKEVPQCSWWDQQSQSWKSDGCNTLGLVTLSDSSQAVECSCVHLTDFAVLVNEAEGDCVTRSAKIYRVIAVLYLLVLILALFQLGRIIYSLLLKNRKSSGTNAGRSAVMRQTWKTFLCCKFGWNALATQHTWVTLICFFRMLSAFALSGTLQIGLAALAFITAVPYCFHFWLFSTIVLEWANVIHLSIKEQKTERSKLRPYLYTINLMVFILILIFLYSISDKWRPAQVSTIVSALMAAIYLITGIAFVIYGSLLAQRLAHSHLTDVSDRTTSQSTAKQHVLSCSLAGRIAMVAVSISLCFIMEAILWAVSVVDSDPALNFAFSFMDIISLLAVLLIFYKSVQKVVREGKEMRRQYNNEPSVSVGPRVTQLKGDSGKLPGSVRSSDSRPGSPSRLGMFHAHKASNVPSMMLDVTGHTHGGHGGLGGSAGALPANMVRNSTQTTADFSQATEEEEIECMDSPSGGSIQNASSSQLFHYPTSSRDISPVIQASPSFPASDSTSSTLPTSGSPPALPMTLPPPLPLMPPRISTASTASYISQPALDDSPLMAPIPATPRALEAERKREKKEELHEQDDHQVRVHQGGNQEATTGPTGSHEEHVVAGNPTAVEETVNH